MISRGHHRIRQRLTQHTAPRKQQIPPVRPAATRASLGSPARSATGRPIKPPVTRPAVKAFFQSQRLLPASMAQCMPWYLQTTDARQPRVGTRELAHSLCTMRMSASGGPPATVALTGRGIGRIRRCLRQGCARRVLQEFCHADCHPSRRSWRRRAPT